MSNRKLPTQIGQGIVFDRYNSIRGGVRDEQNRIEVAAMAEQAEMTKKDAEKALTAFTEVVAKELKNGGKVQIDWLRYILKYLRDLQEKAEIPDRRASMKIDASKTYSSRLVRL